jgi:catechol 2,3-dioxygenase-like lactoylglutathione lyase family enzyme
MNLTFVYAPVADLNPALAFYRDTLGWSEAWREGTDTVAFHLPESSVQVMVAVDDGAAAGPMYLVPDVTRFLAERPDLHVVLYPREIPDGQVAGFADPGGNVIYVFDQAKAG